MLTVAYVGSQGRNLFLRSWTNLMTGVTMNPTTGAGIPVLEFGNRFAQMDYKTSGGTDHYDSLQVTLNRRFSQGLTVGTQWTWGHSIGNTGGSNEAQTQQNPFNFEQDRGNNAFDVRHSFNATALYELPFGKGHAYMKNAPSWVETLLGGLGDRRRDERAHGSADRCHPGPQRHRLPRERDRPDRERAHREQRRDPDHAGGQQPLGRRVPQQPAAERGGGREPVPEQARPTSACSSTRRRSRFPAPGDYGNLGRWALQGPGAGAVRPDPAQALPHHATGTTSSSARRSTTSSTTPTSPTRFRG